METGLDLEYEKIKKELNEVKVVLNKTTVNNNGVFDIGDLIEDYHNSEHHLIYNSWKFVHLEKGYTGVDSMRDYFNKLGVVAVGKKEDRFVGRLLPLSLKPKDKLKRGDVFLWRSGMTGVHEIHTFHSDAGYGAKTFTNYNEKDGSSMIINYSGICGVLVGNDR